MNFSALDQAIRRHRLAWKLLRYAAQHDQQAEPRFGRALLSIWSQERGADSWFYEHPDHLPEELQPAKSELRQICRLLAPFASALLHLAPLQGFGELAPFQLASQTWRRPPGGKAIERARLEFEQRTAALRRVAVQGLLSEAEFAWLDGGYDPLIDAFLHLPSIDADLTHFAYGFELTCNHRVADDGSGAHYLWLKLPSTTRAELSAALIFAARDRLHAALWALAEDHTATPAIS